MKSQEQVEVPVSVPVREERRRVAVDVNRLSVRKAQDLWPRPLLDTIIPHLVSDVVEEPMDWLVRPDARGIPLVMPAIGLPVTNSNYKIVLPVPVQVREAPDVAAHAIRMDVGWQILECQGIPHPILAVVESDASLLRHGETSVRQNLRGVAATVLQSARRLEQRAAVPFLSGVFKEPRSSPGGDATRVEDNVQIAVAVVVHDHRPGGKSGLEIGRPGIVVEKPFEAPV